MPPQEVKCWSLPPTKEVDHFDRNCSFVFGKFHFGEIWKGWDGCVVAENF